MTKKFIVTLLTATIFMVTGSSVSAEQYGQGTYGQGTVLGSNDEVKIVHKPVNTGLRENLAVVGLGFISVSMYFYRLSKKAEIN